MNTNRRDVTDVAPSGNALVTVHLRVPAAFREALRRVVGKRMAESGARVTEGEVLFDLVRAAGEVQS